jgi:hypothetical protein
VRFRLEAHLDQDARPRTSLFPNNKKMGPPNHKLAPPGCASVEHSIDPRS